ncbi:LysR family transcriptional regulator [Comamonas fluminis]|uniref:LysR family transcriptional regulator n=1 Tax=Comamonas fluminis TaxID=2796366 RepID=UPI001C48D5C9|nr:LysR family transcriptional regulator [Comamonas fluminis]
MPTIRNADAPQFEVNRSGELEVFVKVAEKGSFSAAARQLGVSPSAVSKIVARMESRLGAQLVLRSTRRVQLTPEGCQLYERGQRVLADLNEVENAASLRSVPKGVVRINSSTSISQLLGPLIPQLMRAYPELVLDLSCTDQVVDLMEAQADIAIRWGKLPASDMVARLLGYTRQVILASPSYLAAHGTPHTPADLDAHIRIGWNYQRTVPHWPFAVDGKAVEVPIGDVLRVNDGDVMRKLAIQGAGLARLSLYHAWDDIAAGRLQVVLEQFNTGVLEPIHAVYLGKPDQLPPRTRAVLDFLKQHVDLGHAEQLPDGW